MNKRKVFFITSSIRGGAERATITIASELAKHDDIVITLIALFSHGLLRQLVEDVSLIKGGREKIVEAGKKMFMQEYDPEKHGKFIRKQVKDAK